MLLLVPAVARAQGTATVHNQYCSRAINPNDPSYSKTVQNGYVASSCIWKGWAVNEASAIEGVLRAASWFDPFHIAPGDFQPGNGFAGVAEWRDRLIVGRDASDAAFARLTFYVGGFLKDDGVSDAYASFQASGGVSESYRPDAVGGAAIVRSYESVVPIVGGQAAFYFQLVAGVTGVGRHYDAGVWSAYSEFGNSAGVTNVRVLDANMRPINGATYSFAEGLELYTATVPEPGTWALLGAGLVGLGGVAHRRRRWSKV
jgi:hypothetical protein